MEIEMSYRDKPPSDPPPRISTPPLPNDYDADDENTLEFSSSDFVLPDGSAALNPSVLNRIEDARKLLNRLDVKRKDSDTSASSSAGASMNWKEEKKGTSFIFGGLGKDQNGERERHLKGTWGGVPKKMGILVNHSQDSGSLLQTSESSRTEAGVIGKAPVKRRKGTDMMDQDAENKPAKDGETRIRDLEEIIKSKDKDIELLEALNIRHVGNVRMLLLEKKRACEVVDPRFREYFINKQGFMASQLPKSGSFSTISGNGTGQGKTKKILYPIIRKAENPYWDEDIERNPFFSEEPEPSYETYSTSCFNPAKNPFFKSLQEEAVRVENPFFKKLREEAVGVEQMANIKVKKRKAIPKENDSRGIGEPGSEFNQRVKKKAKVSWADAPTRGTVSDTEASFGAPFKPIKPSTIRKGLGVAKAQSSAMNNQARSDGDTMDTENDILTTLGVESQAKKKVRFAGGDFWTSPNQIQPTFNGGKISLTRHAVLNQKIFEDEQRAKENKNDESRL